MILQIALVKTLKWINLTPDIMVGIKTGDLVAAYFNQCLDLKEIVLKAINYCVKGVLWDNIASVSVDNDAEVAIMGSADESINKILCFFPNDVNNFLATLGKFYLNGFDMDLAKLYPEVMFPVSRGTPMISPHISWRQDRDSCDNIKLGTNNLYNYVVNVGRGAAEDTSYLHGHVIDGKNLIDLSLKLL